MKFQNIIFDFDGTLVDSAPAILVAFSRVFEQLADILERLEEE